MMRVRLLAGVLTIAMVRTGGSGGRTGDEADQGATTPVTVRLAVTPWVGDEASNAVIAYLREHELGYKVELVKAAEADSWKGFEKGTVGVVIENWAHPELK